MTGPLVDDSMLRLLDTELSNMLEVARKTDQHGLLVNDALRQRDGSLAGHAREHIEHFETTLVGAEPDE